MKKFLIYTSFIFVLFSFVSCKSVPKEQNYYQKEMIKIPRTKFALGKTEVTYKQWYEVYMWAIQNGYEFSNPGREGNLGKDGEQPVTQFQPVTNISWRDAVVWCNALSEKEGLVPVYYLNVSKKPKSKNVLRKSDNVIHGKGNAENCLIKKNANGYRLPIAKEWRWASTGNGENIATMDSIIDFVWYKDNSNRQTHEVKQLSANIYGLYDMFGNVSEFVFADSSHDSNEPRYFLGGNYSNTKEKFKNQSWYDICSCNSTFVDTGFRLCRNIK